MGNKVHQSLDIISREMAQEFVNDKKKKLESELNKEIIKVDKKKRKREKELRKISKKIFDYENSESGELINSKIIDSLSHLKPRRTNSNKEMDSFKPRDSIKNHDKIKIKNEHKSKFYKDTNNNKNNNDNNNEKNNNNIINNSKQNKENNKKEDIEVTILPYYGYNEEEDKEINYYNIRYYIDNKKRLENKKNLNKQKFQKNPYYKSFHIKNNNSRNTPIMKSNSFKNIKKDKKDYSFLFEQKQKIDDSDDWIEYLEDLTIDKNNKVFLYEDSKKNDSFNISYKDSSNFNDSDIMSIKGNNIKQNKNLIFDYFQNKKEKDFFTKQLNRKRLTEIKINRKRERIKFLENQNNFFTPKIDDVSEKMVKSKGNYIPIYKRAIELGNEKKTRILISQKLQNKSYSVNESKVKKRTQKQINDFYKKQIEWKDDVENVNSMLRLKLQLKESSNSTEINLTPKLNKSEINIFKRKNNPKTSFKLYDNKICKSVTYSMFLNENNKTNVGFRLYKDYEKRQKNLEKLKKKLTPTFTPLINKPSPSLNHTRNNSWISKKRKNYISREPSSSSYTYEYDSSYNSRQKSRNPKKNRRSTNYNNSPQPFNFKEMNNNLKSTAVDSRNSKSRLSIDIFGTKLEKIKEYKDPDEEYSSSDLSYNNISNNILKSNKNVRNSERGSKLSTYRKSKTNIYTYNISEEKSQSKLDNTTNKSINKDNNDYTNSNKEETKSISINEPKNDKEDNKDDNNDNKDIHSNYNSGIIFRNLKLEDDKSNLYSEPKNSNKESQTPTIGKNNENINLNINTIIKKKSIETKDINEIEKIKEIKETKEIQQQNEIIEKKEEKENKEDKENKEKINSIKLTENFFKINNNTNNNNINNNNINNNNINNNNINNNINNININNYTNNNINNNNNIDINRPKKANSIKQLFSKEKESNSPLMRKAIFKKGISKSIVSLNNQSNSLITNKFNETTSHQFYENTFKNQYDSIDTNQNLFNFEQKESNYLNEFLSNRSSLLQNSKEEKIVNNSFFDFQKQIQETSSKKKDETKKTEREILKQYNLNDSEKDDEKSSEEEETENKNDLISNNDKDKNKSWIKKLNDISRNERLQIEKSSNKRKTGGSTTRSQTQKKIEKDDYNNNKINDNLDENKLYMINLRSSSSTGNLEPFTVVAKDSMFYRFFLKGNKK